MKRKEVAEIHSYNRFLAIAMDQQIAFHSYMSAYWCAKTMCRLSIDNVTKYSINMHDYGKTLSIPNKTKQKTHHFGKQTSNTTDLAISKLSGVLAASSK